MKVLIVDDSAVMRLMVKKIVKAAGFDAEFVEAEDGIQGLEKIESESPGLVLCDWNMPNMTGIELLEKLREVGISVNFGFVTTEASEAMRTRAREAGAKFLVSKPFTEESMRSALQPYF
ncbi:MAG TPA: response regulator [Porticoccaceae bacterium]|nr:response regulator [Porticoccaceae bacterium]HCO61430.1 response regulator [Porticoccaceae bacterium]